MRFLLLMVLLIVFSCKPDTGAKTSAVTDNANQAPMPKENNSQKSKTAEATNLSTKKGAKSAKRSASQPAKGKTNFNNEGIPDACDLLTAKTIARYVGQPAENIFLADGSSPQNPKARACFFKWDGSAIANAGVMVQLQKNPVAEDVPEYFTYLISSKKTEGDKDPASDKVMRYKDWPGFGDDGAYSTDAGKYVWRIDNDWAFMVAFNTVLAPKAQKIAAEAFAKEVMSNMTY